MNKCTVVIFGLVFCVSAYAFFNMMQMPQQAMQMMIPPQQPTVCKCDCE